MSTTTETVRLNVGGTKFEVSRPLIERQPNTMLARLVSDTWQKDPESEIFVDGDGAVFRYVLQYMRHQKVCLPMDIPKPTMLQELEYYGFQEVPPDAINESYSVFTAATLVATCHTDIETYLTDQKKAMKEFETETGFSMLAFECFKHYCATGKLDSYRVPAISPAISENPHSMEFRLAKMLQVASGSLLSSWRYHAAPGEKISNRFNEHLSKYGLKFDGSHPCKIVLKAAATHD